MDTVQQKTSSMSGKRVIITGATSGIGKETAFQLAGLGAELVIACRDAGRGARAAEEIGRLTGSTNCSILPVDTSSRESVREFARKVCKQYSRLDVLINNAGIYNSKRENSVDGIELTFATNVLGYFVMIQELAGLLRSSAPARIVNVASAFAGDLDLADLQFERRGFDGQKAYKQSKACDRLLTWAFARRFEGSGVTVNAMAPGLVMTGLYRNTSPAVRLLLRVVRIFLGRTVSQGADTVVWLASSPQVAGVNGKFFEKRRELPCTFRNDKDEEMLWKMCEKMAQ